MKTKCDIDGRSCHANRDYFNHLYSQTSHSKNNGYQKSRNDIINGYDLPDMYKQDTNNNNNNNNNNISYYDYYNNEQSRQRIPTNKQDKWFVISFAYETIKLTFRTIYLFMKLFFTGKLH
jgi:hypothetical protein